MSVVKIPTTGRGKPPCRCPAAGVLCAALLPVILAAAAPAVAQVNNFSAGANYPVPGLGAIAIGDFDGDKSPDIVMANGDSTVSILLGNGDGTFKAQYTVQAVPSTGAYSTYLTMSVAVGDFNDDGKLDLAVLCDNPTFSAISSQMGSVNILLGDGTGHFSAPSVIPLDGGEPMQLLAADFNNDGKLDLAVLNVGSASVTVLLGAGNGSFSPLPDSPIGSKPSQGTSSVAAVGDFNKDGKLDLAIAGVSGADGVVSVLLGKGDGTFLPPTNWTTCAPSQFQETCGGPTAVAIGDFTGNGNLDVAVDDGDPGGIFVLLGNGDGTFQTPPVHSGGAACGGCPPARAFFASGDFNGDGKLDLAEATGSYGGGYDLYLYFGGGDGTFALPLPLTIGSARDFSVAVSVIASDLNGDGFPDLALATGTSTFGLGFNAVTVLLNCGVRCSTAAPTATTISASPDPSAPGQSVAFTASVAPSTSGVPTGTVFLADNAVQFASQQLDATGSATFTTSSLTGGIHSITAAYSGDPNFAPSTSVALTQIVGANAAPFSLSPSPTSATVSAGGSAIFIITAATVPSLKTAILLSCSGLPTGASCSFNPAQMTPSGAATMASLTVTTAGSASALGPSPGPPAHLPLAILLEGLLLSALLVAAAGKNPASERAALPAFALLCVLAMLSSAVACGGSSRSPNGTPAGTTQFTVTGTSGGASQSIAINLTVN